MTPHPVRVGLVEDHAATRQALLDLLGDFPERVQVVGAFPDAESFLASPALARVAVAVVDLGLPGLGGADAIRALGAREPPVRSLALTVFEDEKSVFDAMRAGAFGYLLKDEPAERLVRAIEEAAEGAHPLSSRVAGFFVAHARRRPPDVVLSDREEELARALAEGLSYAECAQSMGIALGTVQDYVKRIYRKLGVSSKKEVRQWIERLEARR